MAKIIFLTVQSSAQPLPTSSDDACLKFFVWSIDLLYGVIQMHEPSILVLLPFLCTISLSLHFFFFSDPFPSKITLVCKQLQNETDIFNLQMGVPPYE